MSYDERPSVTWDKGGPLQGVTITRQLEDGNKYVWYIPHNGVVPQAMAADILDVSLMTVNNWVRSGALRDIKQKTLASVIPLREIKRVHKILLQHGRLRRDARGR
jgi:hypothetical protein